MYKRERKRYIYKCVYEHGNRFNQLLYVWAKILSFFVKDTIISESTTIPLKKESFNLKWLHFGTIIVIYTKSCKFTHKKKRRREKKAWGSINLTILISVDYPFLLHTKQQTQIVWLASVSRRNVKFILLCCSIFNTHSVSIIFRLYFPPKKSILFHCV